MADVKITTSLDGVNAVKAGMSSMGDAAKTLKGVLTTALAGIGFGALIKSTIDAGDQIQKLSIKLGASTEALSQYKHVAGLAGVSLDQLAMGWQYMSRSISEASQGTGTAVDALDELGISAKKLKTLAPEQQFEVLADAIGQVENASDRTRLASDLFGARQTALLQVMEGGSEAMRAARAEADSYGLTLSRTATDNMAAFNDGLERLKNAGLGFVNMIAVHMGPALQSIGHFLGNVLPTATQFFADAINGMRIFALKAFEGILEGLQWVLDKLGKLPGKAGEAAREHAQHLGQMAQHVNILADEYTVATMETQEFKIETGKAVEEVKLATGETNKSTTVIKENTKAKKEATAEGVSYAEAMRRVKEAEDANNAAKERAIKAYKEWLEPAGMTIDATGEIVDINKKAVPVIHDHTAAAKELGDEYIRGSGRVQDWGKIFRQEHHTVYDSVADVVWNIKGAWHGFFQAVITEGSSFRSAMSQLWDGIKRAILSKMAEVVADAVWNKLASLITGKQSQLNGLIAAFNNLGASSSRVSVPTAPTGGAAGGAGAMTAGTIATGAVVGGIIGTVVNGLVNRGTGTINAAGYDIKANSSGWSYSNFNYGDFGSAAQDWMNKTSVSIYTNSKLNAFLSAARSAIGNTSSGEGADVYRALLSRLSVHATGQSQEEMTQRALSGLLSGAKSWLGTYGSYSSDGIINRDENVSLQSMLDRGFATGGRAMFSRPSLIAVAENGPEMISAKPAASGPMNGGAQIVFNGPVFLDEITYNRMQRGMLYGLEQAGSRF